MHDRLSGLKSGLPCPRCGRSLVPVAGDASITFHCKTGHELGLLEAVCAPSSALRAGLESLAWEWDRQRQALRRIVDDAARRGHVDIAEIFARHVKVLETRLELMNSAFRQTESSKLIRVGSN